MMCGEGYKTISIVMLSASPDQLDIVLSYDI